MRHRPRVLLAKPGLDGHDRGVKVVAMALRDEGFEVVYLGLRQDVDTILRSAVDEDVDLIGLSILSGSHLTLTTELLRRREEVGLTGIPVVVGGTVPPRDKPILYEAGVVDVFPVGTPLPDVVDRIRAAIQGDLVGAHNA